MSHQRFHGDEHLPGGEQPVNLTMVDILTRHNSHNWGSLTPFVFNGQINPTGLWAGATFTDTSSSVSRDSRGVYFHQVGNTSAYMQTISGTNYMHAMEMNSIARMRIALDDVSEAFRYFCGFTSLEDADPILSDDPAGTRAGLSFLGSSGNFAFTSKNNGGSEERTDTGIAPDDEEVFEFMVELLGYDTIYLGERVVFTLFDEEGTVLTTATHDTSGGVPSGSNGMQYYSGLELNVGNGGIGYSFFGAGGGNRFLGPVI